MRFFRMSFYCVILLNVILLNVTLLNVTLLNITLLNVTLLNVTLLNVTLLNVTLLNVTLLNVVVPFFLHRFTQWCSKLPRFISIQSSKCVQLTATFCKHNLKNIGLTSWDDYQILILALLISCEGATSFNRKPFSRQAFWSTQ